MGNLKGSDSFYVVRRKKQSEGGSRRLDGGYKTLRLLSCFLQLQSLSTKQPTAPLITHPPSYLILKIMFTSVFTFLPLALSVAASVLPQPRTIVSTHGRIEAPTTKAKVSVNTSIGIKYVPGDWCHTGYSPITVWVTDSEPTASSIDADTGVFKDGEFKAFIGSYTVPNYGKLLVFHSFS